MHDIKKYRKNIHGKMCQVWERKKFITFVLSQDKYSDLQQLCVNLNNKDAPIFFSHSTETMLFGKVSEESF
jgi:hypothetical protein